MNSSLLPDNLAGGQLDKNLGGYFLQELGVVAQNLHHHLGVDLDNRLWLNHI